MADEAVYEIKVSQSGLIARPLNQAARSGRQLALSEHGNAGF